MNGLMDDQENRFPKRLAAATKSLKNRPTGVASPSVTPELCRHLRAVRRPATPGELQDLLQSGLSWALAQWLWDFASAQPAKVVESGGHGPVQQLWDATAQISSYLDEKALQAFIRAAGWTGDREVLAAAWRLLRPKLTVTTLSLRMLSNALRQAGTPDMLADLVAAVEQQRPKVDAASVGALASACGKLHRRDLLERAWIHRRSEPGDLGTFATAWVDVGNPDRFGEVWRAFLDECPLADANNLSEEDRTRWSRMWGGFAGAVSRTETVSVGDVWTLAEPFLSCLDERALASFAEAAARRRDIDIVSKATVAALAGKSNELTLASLIKSAGHTNDPRLVAAVWQPLEKMASLSPQTLRRVASAMHHTRAVEAFDSFWAWIERNEPAFDGPSCGALALACSALDRSHHLPAVWGLRSTSTDGLGAIAMAAAEAGSRDLFDLVWSAANSDAQFHRPPDDRSAFKVAVTWCSLAQAAAELGHEEAFTELWAKFVARGAPTAMEFGAFARAAAQLGNNALLAGILQEALAEPAVLGSKEWAALATAAGEAEDLRLLRRVWEAIPQFSVLQAQAWGIFAIAAGQVGDANLLREIFAAWPGARVRFEGTDHGGWASFFAAANRLQDPALFIEFFLLFEAQFDPARWPNRGSLQRPLWEAAFLLPSKEGELVAETLIGLRLDVDAMLSVLKTEQNQRRFEGALRCLSRWLINSYFHHPFETYRSNLNRLAAGLQALDRRLEAWAAFFYRAKESYLGGLQNRHERPFRQLIRALTDVPDNELAAALDRQDLVALFTAFLETTAQGPAGEVWQPPPDAPARALEPLVTLYVNNLKEFVAAGQARRQVATTDRRDNYFTQVLTCIQDPAVASLTEEDWVDVLHWTITTTATEIWPVMDQMGRQVTLHHAKNIVHRTFKRLKSASEDEERLKVSLDLKRQLRGLAANLKIKDTGTTMPISIASLLRSKLSGTWGKLSTSEINIPQTLRIAAWEGARQVLEPMLFEIRFNMERAVSALPPERRLVRISVDGGTGDDIGYAVLTVTNAYGHDPANEASTRRGLSIIQRLAMLLSSRQCVGYATAVTNDALRGEKAHTVRVFLPLPDGETFETATT